MWLSVKLVERLSLLYRTASQSSHGSTSYTITFSCLSIMAHQMIGTMQSRERVPVPSHRHAMPSGPWPWMDLDSEETDGANDPPLLNREDWHNYPQSLFPNWTFDQVRRSSMMIKAGQAANCGIYVVDVKAVDGCFEGPTEIAAGQDEKELWDMLQARVGIFQILVDFLMC